MARGFDSVPAVKSEARVELFLNIAWLVVAGVIVCLWLCSSDRPGPERRQQMIALAVLIAILFPVISVRDDLFAVQNANETDNYLRRDHLVPSGAHPVQPLLSILPAMIFAGLGLTFQRFLAPGALPVQKEQHPELAGIENRPPPAA